MPCAGNLAGGGFMIVHNAVYGEAVAIDYREVAPAAAYRDMFPDEEKSVDHHKSGNSIFLSESPALLADLYWLWKNSLPFRLPKFSNPRAIQLASEGFPVGQDLAASLADYKKDFSQFGAVTKVFYKSDGYNYAIGESLVQPELAESLRRLPKKSWPTWPRMAV
ncbi:MAG: Gamma-glutamyltranspeptidase [Verrucomicrobia subdivision 3 bacterium]|nr:Gamma-glutamyltranspeptidase [Limisphaerales bacterium]MCS1417122.1 Gamma-glutamyltranspeptidase [Limisphaerales bacterium]